MLIELAVRRFKCLNERCPAVTLVAQIDGLISAYARYTPLLTSIALCLAGRPGPGSRPC